MAYCISCRQNKIRVNLRDMKKDEETPEVSVEVTTEAMTTETLTTPKKLSFDELIASRRKAIEDNKTINKMEKLDIPKFETQKELFDFLVTNKESLIAQKCSAIKFADSFNSPLVVVNNSFATKGEVQAKSASESTEFLVKAVINTTGIMDSHSDVHVKGLWNKSLKENKRMMHLQEHKGNEFNKIISSGSDLKAYVKDYTWKELGYDAEGTTQALVFESLVKQSRNPYMFEQYKNGYVDNHSVGMQYVKLALAINDKDYANEKALYDNHIGDIVNSAAAEKQGFFWLVTEAKAIEGSAVPNGSNSVTPTLSVEAKNEVGVAETEKMKAIKAFLGIE